VWRYGSYVHFDKKPIHECYNTKYRDFIMINGAKRMQKILFISTSLLAILVSCSPKPFKGFLVCKEYIPGHMDDEHVKTVQEAYVYVPVPVVYPRRHESEYIPSAWKFYVANKRCVREFSVDSLTYTKHKVGERIVMNY